MLSIIQHQQMVSKKLIRFEGKPSPFRSELEELYTNTPLNKLIHMKIPKSIIKTLMKNIHLNAIKYLTYLVLNKRKLESKHNIVTPPP